MDSTKRRVRESPIDFQFAFAYALHPTMRRLIIVSIVGSLLISFGISWFFHPPTLPIIDRLTGIAIAILGTVLFFGGLIGGLFKLFTDAMLVANDHIGSDGY